MKHLLFSLLLGPLICLGQSDTIWQKFIRQNAALLDILVDMSDRTGRLEAQIGDTDLRIQLFNLHYEIDRLNRRLDSLTKRSTGVQWFFDSSNIKFYQPTAGKSFTYPSLSDSAMPGYHWIWKGEDLRQEVDTNWQKPVPEYYDPGIVIDPPGQLSDVYTIHTLGRVDTIYTVGRVAIVKAPTSVKTAIPKKHKRKKKFFRPTTILCTPVRLIQDTSVFKAGRNKSPISH